MTVPFLPERRGETDDEKRFRESINRQTEQLMKTVDAAMALRTAPSEAKRTRHLARGALQDFALRASLAFAQAGNDAE